MGRISYVEANVTVDHEELKGSPTEAYTATGAFTAQRVLKCLWSESVTLALQLVGGPLSSSGSGVDDFTIALPDSYLGNTRVRVTTVDKKPFFPAQVKADAGDIQRAAYTDAELTVNYSSFAQDPTLDKDNEIEIIADESIEATTEFITGPEFPVCWQNDNSTARFANNIPLTKQINGFDYIYTRHQMPGVPNILLTGMGKVNNGTIRSGSLGFTFASATLLYKSLSLSRQITSEGISAWKGVLRFGFRGADPEATWQKFWDFSSNRWDFLTVCKLVGTTFSNGPIILPYKTISFGGLLG